MPDSQLDYEATTFKTAWHRHKNKHINSQDRSQSPEIEPTLYGQLVLDAGAEA